MNVKLKVIAFAGVVGAVFAMDGMGEISTGESGRVSVVGAPEVPDGGKEAGDDNGSLFGSRGKDDIDEGGSGSEGGDDGSPPLIKDEGNPLKGEGNPLEGEGNPLEDEGNLKTSAETERNPESTVDNDGSPVIENDSDYKTIYPSRVEEPEEPKEPKFFVNSNGKKFRIVTDEDLRESKRTGREITGLVRIENEKGYFEGHFVDGMANGYGEFYFKNGAVYKGCYVNNNAHGEGTYRFADGSTYEGDFENDRAHGRGKLTGPNGEIIREGRWINGIEVTLSLPGPSESGEEKEAGVKLEDETADSLPSLITDDKESPSAPTINPPGIPYSPSTSGEEKEAGVKLEDETANSLPNLIMGDEEAPSAPTINPPGIPYSPPTSPEPFPTSTPETPTESSLSNISASGSASGSSTEESFPTVVSSVTDPLSAISPAVHDEENAYDQKSFEQPPRWSSSTSSSS
ncbi:MAG: hypothetical protein LBG13_00460 [Holosporales bacterium]|jgi:hypothetical protein|nr:hypothetical protein [Holosporales bacterium]